MREIRFDLDHIPVIDEPISLALGNFDGMHLGHAEVLFSCVYDGTGTPSILLLSPTKEAKEAYSFLEAKNIMTSEEKTVFAKSRKIELCLLCDASIDFYALTAEEFVENVLKNLHVKEIFCGEDYTFGKDGAGDVALLKKHFVVHAIPLLHHQNEKIASRKIRDHIIQGKMEEVEDLLGHPFQLSSKIEEGYRRGSTLGFPTANLTIEDDQLLPKVGVYYGVAYVHGIPYPSIINIGSNPTFQNDHVSVEVHMMGFEGGDLYGYSLYVDFLGWLREERSFENEKALIKQLEKDKENALALLGDF